WADEGSDLVLIKRQADGFERFAGTVIEVEVADGNLLRQAARADRCVGDGGNGNRGYIHDCVLDAASARATIESTSTVKVMISAPVQASACQSLEGESENWKMAVGRLAIGALRFVLQN